MSSGRSVGSEKEKEAGADDDVKNPADDDKDNDDDDDAMKTLEKTSLAWGAGAHVCPGRHLAELIIARLVPLLVSEFDVEIVEMPRVKDMRSFNYFATLSGVKARFHVRPQIGGPEEKRGERKRKVGKAVVS